MYGLFVKLDLFNKKEKKDALQSGIEVPIETLVKANCTEWQTVRLW